MVKVMMAVIRNMNKNNRMICPVQAV